MASASGATVAKAVHLGPRQSPPDPVNLAASLRSMRPVPMAESGRSAARPQMRRNVSGATRGWAISVADLARRVKSLSLLTRMLMGSAVGPDINRYAVLTPLRIPISKLANGEGQLPSAPPGVCLKTSLYLIGNMLTER